MKRGEDVARLDPGRDPRLQLDAAVRAAHRDERAVADPQPLGVLGMDLEPVLGQQVEVAGAPGHRAGVVVLEAPAGHEDDRELLGRLAAGRLVGQRRELSAAAGQRRSVSS